MQESFTSNGVVIKKSTTYKDLGIQVENSLTWSNHVRHLCSKAYGALHTIRRTIPWTSSVVLRKRLFLTLVRSYFGHCSQLWRPQLFKDISALERVQRRATKFILYNASENYKARLRLLHLLPLSLWLELRDILFVIKCMQAPPDNFDIFQYVSFVSSSTRATSGGKLAYKYSRTNRGRHFFFNRVTRLWNSLANIINLEQSFSTNRARLQNRYWDYFESSFDPTFVCTYNICCPCSVCHMA